jgi:hypothetical protein
LARIARLGVIDMLRTRTWLALAAWMGLAGCAADKRDRPAPAAAPPTRSEAVYLGWRVFQDKCASCHGSAATGRSDAPDLTARVRTLGPREFADLVLLRYEWASPPSASGPSSAEREAYIDDLVLRRKGELTMPPWQGEPRVTAHVIDLHAYLSARADGTQGPGRPPRP